MSTEELRRELARISDGAPVAGVPDDTWARARRSTYRDRALLAGAVAVVVAMVVGLVAWLPDRSEPPPADGESRAAVPTTLWSVPGPSEGGPAPVPRLDVGPAAASYLTDAGEPVVIDANDGTAHVLDLPGWGEMQHGQPATSLSPDGRFLAWGWSGSPAGGTAPTPSGVRVLDLVTGDHRTVDLTGGKGVLVYRMQWSADSRWLLWEGAATTRWDADRLSAGADLAGLVAPGATTSRDLPVPQGENPTYAVDDEGTVFAAATDEVLRWRDGVVLDRHPYAGWFPTVVDATAGVVLESRERGGDANGYRIEHRRVEASRHDLAEELAQRQIVPMGWLDRQTLVAGTWSVAEQVSRVSVIDLGGEPTLRDVADFRGGGQLTVAVDLMRGDSPTVERPSPPWLDEDGNRAWLPVLIVGGAVLLCVAAAWLIRRRRPRADPLM